jgi:hypothetical protein
MLAADRDHTFARRVVGAVVVVMALADGLLQLERSAGGGVLGEIGVDGSDGGPLSGVGKSGSPAPKSTTSIPSRRRRSASAATFMVDDSLIREMRSAKSKVACMDGVKLSGFS